MASALTANQSELRSKHHQIAEDNHQIQASRPERPYAQEACCHNGMAPTSRKANRPPICLNAICLKVHLHRTSYSCPRQTSNYAATFWVSRLGKSSKVCGLSLTIWCLKGFHFQDWNILVSLMSQAHAHGLTMYLFARPFQALPVSLRDFWEVFDNAWQSLIFIVWVFHVTPGFTRQEMLTKSQTFVVESFLGLFTPNVRKPSCPLGNSGAKTNCGMCETLWLPR